MAGDYLQLIQGDTYSLSTNVAVDGVGSNLSGATVWFIAMYDPADTDASQTLFNVSTATGQISISGANNNVVTVNMNSSYTANIAEANVAHWALRTVTSGGAVYTLDRGRIAVVPGMPADI